jgi:hypothetical protein
MAWPTSGKSEMSKKWMENPRGRDYFGVLRADGRTTLKLILRNRLWRMDSLLCGDPVNSGRCYVTLAICTHATIEQRDYATSFSAMAQ